MIVRDTWGKPRPVGLASRCASELVCPSEHVPNVFKSPTGYRRVVDTSPIYPGGRWQQRWWQINQARLPSEQRFDARQNTRVAESVILCPIQNIIKQATQKHCASASNHRSHFDFIGLETVYDLKISTPFNRKFPKMLQKCNSTC